MTFRAWLTPVLAISGASTLFTGLLLLLHAKTGFIAGLHEAGGLVFALASLGHLQLNWKPLLKTVCNGRALLIMLIAAAFLLTAGALWGNGKGKKAHLHRRAQTAVSLPAATQIPPQPVNAASLTI